MMVAMGTRVLRVGPEVDAALDAAADAAGVLAGEVDTLAAPQLAVMVPAVAMVIARFEAVRLAAVRAADRADVAAQAGMPSTAEWMAGVTGEKRGKARGDVELAEKLADMGEIADTLASGEVSKPRPTRCRAPAVRQPPSSASSSAMPSRCRSTSWSGGSSGSTGNASNHPRRLCRR